MFTADKTGRSTRKIARSKDRQKARQWRDEPFIQLGLSFFISPAWKVLSPNAKEIFYRLLIEHMDHGGRENGKIPCTYSDFEKYGVRRKSISKALDGLEALGFIEIVRRGHLRPEGESGAPSLYRITCYHTYRADGVNEATNEWKKFGNLAEAKAAAKEHHVQKSAHRSKKYGARFRKKSNEACRPDPTKI